MSKKKIKDQFPSEVYVQHYAESSRDGERTAWLNVQEDEASVFDHDPGEAAEEGTRVGVYKLVGVVKMTKRVTVTRKKVRR